MAIVYNLSMQILSPSFWNDYELLDSGNGHRLERFGSYRLVRPDPQVIWNRRLEQTVWDKADAIFERTSADKGQWRTQTQIPDKWLMHYKNLSFYAKLTPFKHTGVFPEQSAHWDWMEKKIKQANHAINVLNLFAYTGIASLACAAAGAEVTHVDASRSAIGWARENQAASKFEDKPIRWILDDVVKFVQREIKRGKKYDAIIMDPPIFGHGASGETWKFHNDFPKLLHLCKQILSDKPLCILVNAYAISASAFMLQNVLEDITSGLEGTITVGELALRETNNNRLLSTGIFGRWESR